MAVNNAAVLLEGLCAAGFAVELTHLFSGDIFSPKLAADPAATDHNYCPELVIV